MKEQFMLLAEYNAQTNEDMIKVLATLKPDQLLEEMGSFYHSILSILNHIVGGDVNWLRRFTNHFPQLGFLSGRIDGVAPKAPGELRYHDLQSYRAVRFDLDVVIKLAMENLAEEEFHEVLVFKNLQGAEMRKTVWLGCLHMFNHETHHRGQVSLALDQMKVDNDYSGLAWRF